MSSENQERRFPGRFSGESGRYVVGEFPGRFSGESRRFVRDNPFPNRFNVNQQHRQNRNRSSWRLQAEAQIKNRIDSRRSHRSSNVIGLHRAHAIQRLNTLRRRQERENQPSESSSRDPQEPGLPNTVGQTQPVSVQIRARNFIPTQNDPEPGVKTPDPSGGKRKTRKRKISRKRR
jgi:hypothetical protein